MNQINQYEYQADGFAADATLDVRLAFIRRVYGHLLGATLLFVACTAVFVSTPAIVAPLFSILSFRWGPVALIVGFMAASYVAQAMASNRANPAAQYAGLGLYSVLQAVIFTPLLYYVQRAGGGPDIIYQAGTVTLVIFGGLTAIVMLSKSDFSFLRNFLWVGSLAALGIVLASAIFGGGFSGSLLFIGAMVVLMSGWILYDTSNVLHHYGTDQHVAAALALFSSLTTLFWYILRFMSSSRD